MSPVPIEMPCLHMYPVLRTENETSMQPTPRLYRYTTLKEEAQPLNGPNYLLFPFPGTARFDLVGTAGQSGLPPMENGPGCPAPNRHRRLERPLTGWRKLNGVTDGFDSAAAVPRTT